MRRGLLLLALVVAVATAHCLHGCKHTHTDKAPGCHLRLDACKCFKHDRYRIAAKDPETNIEGPHSSWTSEIEAGEQAIQGLFLTDNGCNCHGKAFPLGNCTAYVKGCFYWTSTTALQQNKTSFRLFGHVEKPKVSPTYSAVAANETDIEKETIVLIAKMIEFDPHVCKPHTAVEDVHRESGLVAALRHQL